MVGQLEGSVTWWGLLGERNVVGATGGERNVVGQLEGSVTWWRLLEGSVTWWGLLGGA